mmetsp:Transcript_30524/g.65501  ORF Transcript_30524/g.65501 Transcript_30524/m.65501 type:complete len:358 (+) Transcript_30524:283-1356(+)
MSSDTSDNNKDGTPNEDPFWEIALNYDAHGRNFCGDDDSHDGGGGDYRLEHDQNNDHARGGRMTKYHLPNSSVCLELAPLVSDDGIWSPVGDHAWYSSALLTSLIVSGGEATEDRSILGGFVADPTGRCSSNDNNNRNKNNDGSFRVLELGSGAVGLSGMAFAAALSQHPERFPSWTVTLTDNDESLLKQLETNVRSNVLSKNIVLSGAVVAAESESTRQPAEKNMRVEYLDWDLPGDDDNDSDNDTRTRHREHLLSADVVIGSELAYTSETATALTRVLFALLDKNPAVQIWIVQVTDRYGWSEIVVPALESRANTIVEGIPMSCDVHETASTMIPMGGALDRFAFGAFCIRNADR